MTFELPNLPYPKNALEPHISQETFEYHHGKHHAAYVKKLNELVQNTEFEHMDLVEIMKKSSGPIFNNAAQHWNHSFYWLCMSPSGGGEPTGELLKAVNEAFGSFAVFKEKFTAAAIGQFGSGWAWLVKNGDQLEIVATGNAENPLTKGKTPLLTCDVWEHAYYIDTRNDRPKYVSHFWEVVNWTFAAENWAKR
ncbi:MAG TPA: superoxide dismutase [Coxiellaceae bacterium]|nr:superoxide dismutase [Coxiellaceae bacterium]